MSEATNITVPTFAQRVFAALISFYPIRYQKQFGTEMQLLFLDVYSEELIKKGRVGAIFWLSQIADLTKSIIIQHFFMLQKNGLKKYLRQEGHINKYNFWGGLLLLPILSIFIIDTISRITQGDLTHYNRPVYAFLSHTFLYSYPVLFTWVILFPLLAILINLIPIILNSQKKHASLVDLSFLAKNIISVILICIGLGFLIIIKFHDFAPCTIHGILNVGIGQLPHIISVCKNA